MKARIMNGIMKLAGSVAALAMVCAVSNLNSTCLFLTYQPDVPEELVRETDPPLTNLKRRFSL